VKILKQLCCNYREVGILAVYYRKTHLMNHIRLILLSLSLVPSAGLVAWQPVSKLPSTPPRPNILFIMADDLGYGDLSCFGATDLHTPYIDSLIGGGMKFTTFYANSPVCSPSRAALLSGRYPEQVGVPGVIRDDSTDSWGYLAPALLLPNYLFKAGYQTGLVGKWHLGTESPNLPNQRGFEEFNGFLGDMMDDYVTKRRGNLNHLRHNRQVIDPPGHATDVFTNGAIRYLNERARQRAVKTGRPFFLYLAYNAPHNPLQPPATYLDRIMKNNPTINPTRAKLVALIEHLDASVGRVLAALRANGQDKNTIVVFTSDNGGWGPGKATVGPYRGFKGTMYEGGLRIPAGIRWPVGIRPHTTATRPLLLMDWMPTLLELAGAPIPNGLNGRSFAGLLIGKDTTAGSARPLFYVRREGNDGYKGLQIHALRNGDFKLLQASPFTPYELYNLKTDPAETTNLAEQNSVIRDQMTRQLMDHIRKGGAVPWQKSK